MKININPPTHPPVLKSVVRDVQTHVHLSVTPPTPPRMKFCEKKGILRRTFKTLTFLSTSLFENRLAVRCEVVVVPSPHSVVLYRYQKMSGGALWSCCGSQFPLCCPVSISKNVWRCVVKLLLFPVRTLLSYIDIKRMSGGALWSCCCSQFPLCCPVSISKYVWRCVVKLLLFPVRNLLSCIDIKKCLAVRCEVVVVPSPHSVVLYGYQKCPAVRCEVVVVPSFLFVVLYRYKKMSGGALWSCCSQFPLCYPVSISKNSFYGVIFFCITYLHT